MANKYIGDVTTSTPALTDFLIGVNGSDVYKTLVSDVAKKIIENYSGSTIGGSAQTIQNAFTGVNNNIGANNITGYNNRQGWIALTSGQDLNTVTAPGVYYCGDSVAQSLLNCPVRYGFVMKVEITANGNTYLRQTIRRGSVSENGTIHERQMYGSGNWSTWLVQPTRSEVNSIANRGGKNILKRPPTNSSLGITATVNNDGSITVNGTATSNYLLVLGQYGTAYNGKTLRLTGTPQGGSGNTYSLALYNGSNRVGFDRGDGLTYTVPTNNTDLNCRLVIFSGTTVNNLTFYPMLRDASIQDDTYVPYGMSNAELTEDAMLQSTVVTATIGGVDSNWTVRKRYKTVEFTLTTGNVLESAKDGDVIMNLPEGYRPNTTVFVPITMLKGSWGSVTTKQGLLAIATNGNVTLRGNTEDIQASGSIYGTIVFITA